MRISLSVLIMFFPAALLADYGSSLTPVSLNPGSTYLINAASWENGVLPTPANGLIGVFGSTDLPPGGTASMDSFVYDIALWQEGGTAYRDGDLAIRGGVPETGPGKSLWTINDLSNNPATYPNLDLTGALVLWSHHGGPMELNLLSGSVEVAGSFRMFTNLNTPSVLNVRDGQLRAAAFRSVGGTINMLSRGTGTLQLGAFEDAARNVVFNFEAGNKGSITIVQDENGNPIDESDWQALANAGRLQVNGSPAGLGFFHVSADGTTLRHLSSYPGLAAVEGALYKDGRPYRGIGVNYFDLFYDMVKTGPAPDGNYDNYRTIEGLRYLGEKGIPFARFAAIGFWAIDMGLYETNKAAWFAMMDEIVQTAEEAGVGLIPSVFWRATSIPEWKGEYRNAWADPASATRQFMATYINELLDRYNDSPAIWGWEFGNEYNLKCDLPNWKDGIEPPREDLGRVGPATEIDIRNKYTYDIVRSAFLGFSQEIRQRDPHRFITTGNSRPREASWHNYYEDRWSIDSYAQAQEAFGWMQPVESIDMASVHVYPWSMSKVGAEPVYAGATGIQAILLRYREFADQQDQALFIGEYSSFYYDPTRHQDRGPPPTESEQRALETQFLEDMLNSGADLAAYWVYDRGVDRNEIGTIYPGGTHDAVLELIAEYDARMRGESSVTASGIPVDWFRGFSIEPEGWQSWSEVELLDLNGNGMSLRDEYFTGIHPLDSGPVFSITGIDFLEDSSLEISWWGGTHGSMEPYAVESTTNLTDWQSWQIIGTKERSEGLNTWTAPPLEEKARFYRVSAGP